MGARRRATAMSSEHAATEQLHEGGSRGSRKNFHARCKQIVDRQRVFTLSLQDLRVSAQEIGVLSAPTFCCSLALRISARGGRIARPPRVTATLSSRLQRKK